MYANRMESKPKRRYRKITPEVIQRYQTEELLQGNGSAAVAVLEPDVKKPGNRAWAISKQRDKQLGSDIVPKAIQQIAVGAIRRVEEMVHSTDEAIATKNAHFVIDHAIGKAVQRNDNVNVNLNIESVLE